MGFTERFNELVAARGVMARLSKATGISQGLLSNYKNGTDPQLTNAIKIADYFDVSLDYLAGRTEPMAIPYPDAETERLTEGFSQLNRDGRMVVLDTVEFQLSKNAKSEAVQGHRVSGVA